MEESVAGAGGRGVKQLDHFPPHLTPCHKPPTTCHPAAYRPPCFTNGTCLLHTACPLCCPPPVTLHSAASVPQPLVLTLGLAGRAKRGGEGRWGGRGCAGGEVEGRWGGSKGCRREKKCRGRGWARQQLLLQPWVGGRAGARSAAAISFPCLLPLYLNPSNPYLPTRMFPIAPFRVLLGVH